MSHTNIRTFMALRLKAALLAGAVLAGCSKDDILRPDLPDIIDGNAINTPQGAPAVYAGAVSELQYALTGTGNGAFVFSGLFTDEMLHASTPPAVREWDLRSVTTANANGAGIAGPFLLLQRARTALESGAARVAPFFGATDKRIGEMFALSALAHIFVGEMFCSGAPFSERTPDLLYGPPLTTAQVMNKALDRLTTATAATGGDAGISSLVALLRGRALLDLGQFAQAATAVANVPTSFTYSIFHSATTARQNNNIFLQNANDIYGVSDKEGTNGLDYGTAGDPRVPARLSTANAGGFSRNDGVTKMYYYTKYTSASDPVVVASGIEARLIEAEAALQTGGAGAAAWLAKLNEARATIPALTPLVDPGTLPAQVDLMFRERAFWLYMTGHRLGDLRRLVRQYGRGAETVYPTGAYHKQGLVRGHELTFPVPNTEENNAGYTPASCTFNLP
ncbi:MAG: hypothetical protein ABI647_03830 [Gemmatimonadota bacterium]